MALKIITPDKLPKGMNPALVGKVSCICCDKSVMANKGNAYEVDGGHACKNCFASYYVQCTSCKTSKKDHKVAYFVEGAICLDCVQKSYKMCEDCTQYRVLDAVREVRTSMNPQRVVCTQCWAKYQPCKRCECFSNNVRNEYCKQCRSCDCIKPYKEKVTRHIPILGIDANPKLLEELETVRQLRRLKGLPNFGDNPIPMVRSKTSTTYQATKHIRQACIFGVEIEVHVKEEYSIKDAAEAALETVKEFAILKEDASIHYGFEIVTAPAAFSYHMGSEKSPSCWDKFFDLVDNSDYFAKNSPDCGMHIHISKSALTPMQIGKMVVFVHSPENRELIEHIAERGSNKYNDFTKEKRITDYYDRTGGDKEARYTAVNLLPKTTVEIRIFQTVLNRENIYKNLEFTKALIDFCASGVYSYRDMNACKFTAFVSKYRKSYPFLHNFLKKRELELVA